MVYQNILEAIGHTPMIRLNRMNHPGNADIFVKFEGMNAGGSIKTRTAYNMILAAEQQGLINQDTIIVEPTSGNQGIRKRGKKTSSESLWRPGDADP